MNRSCAPRKPKCFPRGRGALDGLQWGLAFSWSLSLNPGRNTFCRIRTKMLRRRQFAEPLVTFWAPPQGWPASQRGAEGKAEPNYRAPTTVSLGTPEGLPANGVSFWSAGAALRPFSKFVFVPPALPKGPSTDLCPPRASMSKWT